MGHVRLGVLPRSRKWEQVVELLRSGAPDDEIAAASADAADAALSGASDDPVFREAVWYLASLPLTARGPGYLAELRELGLPVRDPPSLFGLLASIAAGLDNRAREVGGRTDLGEMAQMALAESLAGAIEPQLPSLFDPESSEVRQALGRLSGGEGFARLARDFFARLTQRSLDYYLSRELANHVGAGRRFATDSDRRAFDAALALHCREASRIVEAFAGGWYGKTVWQSGELERDSANRFARYAFKKIRDELGRRRAAA